MYTYVFACVCVVSDLFLWRLRQGIQSHQWKGKFSVTKHYFLYSQHRNHDEHQFMMIYLLL